MALNFWDQNKKNRWPELAVTVMTRRLSPVPNIALDRSLIFPENTKACAGKMFKSAISTVPADLFFNSTFFSSVSICIQMSLYDLPYVLFFNSMQCSWSVPYLKCFYRIWIRNLWFTDQDPGGLLIRGVLVRAYPDSICLVTSNMLPNS